MELIEGACTKLYLYHTTCDVSRWILNRFPICVGLSVEKSHAHFNSMFISSSSPIYCKYLCYRCCILPTCAVQKRQILNRLMSWQTQVTYRLLFYTQVFDVNDLGLGCPPLPLTMGEPRRTVNLADFFSKINRKCAKHAHFSI